jgi:hypothetical protein
MRLHPSTTLLIMAGMGAAVFLSWLVGWEWWR